MGRTLAAQVLSDTVLISLMVPREQEPSELTLSPRVASQPIAGAVPDRRQQAPLLAARSLPYRALSMNLKEHYAQSIDRLSPKEKLVRAAQMFALVREYLGRQIVAEEGPMSPEVVKWKVALRLYGDEAGSRVLIEEALHRVSD